MQRGCLVVFQIGNVVLKINSVLLEECMHLQACFEAKQLPDFCLGKPLSAITLQSQSLKRSPSSVVSFRHDLPRKLVRNVNQNFHAS